MPSQCTSIKLIEGSCGNFTDIEISPGQCTSIYSTSEQCKIGCCCVNNNNGGKDAYVRFMGACIATDGSMTFYQDIAYTATTCTAKCAGSNTNDRYNITGFVLKNMIIQPGASVMLDGTQQLIVGANGNYSFSNLRPGSHQLKASYDSCNYTQYITVDANNEKFNITLSCPTFNLIGYILDENSNPVSSAIVNATYNKYTTGVISAGGTSKGYYNFSIPYNTEVVLKVQTNAGCKGEGIAYINNEDKKINITTACGTYTLIVRVENSTGIMSNGTVAARTLLYNANAKDSTTNEDVYKFTDLIGGTLVVSAEQTNNYASGSQRCYNSTTLQLAAQTAPISVNLSIGEGTCCNTSVSYGPCISDSLQITTTRSGSCGNLPLIEVEQGNCQAQKSPCRWDCIWSPTCTGGQQTATCTKNTTNCDETLPIPPADTTRPCYPLCRNGVIDNINELCDYNIINGDFSINQSCIDTWHLKDDRIDFQFLKDNPDFITNVVCNLNDCSCRNPAIPRPIPDCSKNPGNVTIFKATSVAEKHSFDISWAFNRYTCENFVDHFELSVCNNDSGECGLGSGNYYMLNNNLGKNTILYTHNGSIDPKILANTQYCYQLTTVFNDSVTEASRIVNNITCITSGDEACLTNHDNSWCIGNLNSSCNDNNLLVSHGCMITTTVIETCSMDNGNAICSRQPLCDQCNRFFGLFNYMGYEVPTKINQSTNPNAFYTLVCPSLRYPVPTSNLGGWSAYRYIFGCYMDYSMTTVDKTYSCSDVTTCYDYKSNESCTQDYCEKFSRNGANSCGWIPFVSSGYSGDNVFGKGVCAPVNASEQHCELCEDPNYNRLGPCAPETCNTFGQCYFEGVNNKCINRADITCDTYQTQDECTGSQILDVNVTWKDNDNNELAGDIKLSGTNKKLKSNDGGQGILGICRWEWKDPTDHTQGGICFRDADNISESIKGDCRIDDGNLQLLCEKDNIAPNTTINNKLKYGLMMNLSGQVVVKDDYYPWMILGAPEKYRNDNWPYTRIFYCIVKGVGGGDVGNNAQCYPNETLRTISDGAYIINLSMYDITKDYDNKKVRIFYFSEDPARNLEYPIKNFTFSIDAVLPNVTVNLVKDSYPESEDMWLTNLTATIKLENTPSETSLPVTCSLKVRAQEISEDAYLAFEGKEDYDIINAKLDYSTSSNIISTEYSELIDGEYYYELNCVDAYDNLYTITRPFNVTGDVRINSPSPFGEKYTTTTGNSHIVDGKFIMPISINTSVDGTCKYSIDPTYNSLLPLTRTGFAGETDNYYHSASVEVSPLANATGIYKYYIKCNLSVNGIYKTVLGNSADNPYFVIDDLPPVTKIQFKNATVQNWEDYNDETLDEITFMLTCNDSYPVLTKNGADLSWKCNNTRYCIIKINGEENCRDEDKEKLLSYKPMPADGISLSYNGSNSDDKRLYGNNPTIRFYSDDNGGNVAPITTQTLQLRNLKLDDPNIIIMLGTGSDTAKPGDTITVPYITLNITYESETNVTIDSIILYNSDKDAYVLLDPRDGYKDKNSYKFRATYIDNGAYKLIVTATDEDGNTNVNTTSFKIAHSPNIAWLESPKMGIGSTKNYNITVMTSYYSDCKHSMSPLTQSLNIAARYNNIVYVPFEHTGSDEHTFEYDGISGILYVICKTKDNLNPNADDAYAITSFHVGYNSTNLSMNITFIQTPRTKPDDNKIINGTYNATIIQVLTDQPAVCVINTTQDNDLLRINNVFFDGENDEIYDKYYTTHTYTINYTDTGAVPGMYYYTINCTSLAQSEAINGSVPVNFTPDTPPPEAHIVLDFKRLTSQSYNVTCTGLCMDTYQKNYSYAVIDVNESCDDATYNSIDYSKQIILRNTSQICVKVKDILGRVATKSLNVTMIVINQGNIDVNYPYAYYDTDTNIIDQVYAPSQTFTLNISTREINADCRYELSDNLLFLGTSTLSEIYENYMSSGNAFDKASNGDIFTHTASFELLSSENTREGWMIICRLVDPNPLDPETPLYIGREFDFYWDNTAPSIISGVIPQRIYDWSARHTALLNVTTDDQTKCILDLVHSTLKNNNNGVIESLNGTSQDVEQLDIGELNSFDSYITNRQHTYNIQNKWLLNINTNNTYKFNISCWNRAMLTQRNVITMLYDLEHSVKVNITSGTIFNGTTLPVIAVTNIKSNCTATLVGEGGQTKEMMSSDGINHNINFSATGGIQNVSVKCYVPDNTDITTAYDTYYAILDNDIPTVTLSSTNNRTYTCGLNGFKINVDMNDDTGIDSYYYSITGPNVDSSLNSVISSDTHGVIDYNDTLQDNGIYTVDVKAKDLSGKYSDNENISITARSPSSSILCDNYAPVPNITLSNTPFLDMIKANVSCTDDTGCRALYDYSFTIKNNCYDELYTNVGSYNSALTFGTNGLLCVKSLDLAGNVGYGQKNITIGVNINNPFNITPIGDGQNYPNVIVYPGVVVTNATITNITFMTDVDAECRYSLTPTNDTNISYLFSNYHPLTQSGSKIHTLDDFNTQGLYEQYMDIICYNPALTEPYSRKIIRIVYTVDIPTINAYADPELVYDWNSRESLLTISTAPETVCTITGNDAQNTPAPGYITGNYSNALTYNTEHKKELFYNINTPAGIFNYIITCRTLGNKEDTRYVNVTYNITDNMSIDLLSPPTIPDVYTNRTVDLIVQTNLISSCSLKWGTSILIDKGEMLANVTSRQHNSKIITTTDGLYTAEIKCVAPISGNQATKNFSIIINTTLPPVPTPICGDGIVNGAEVCDGNSPSGLNGMTCTSGWVTTNYTGGQLKCNSDCSGYDFSNCDNGNGWCGNSELEGPNSQGIYEQCDGSIPSGLSCKDFGFQEGSLSCSNCVINTSNCRQTNGLLGTGSYVCNNNILESGEQCEAGGVYGISCTNFGYSGGNVSCSSCRFSMSSCYFTTSNNQTSGGYVCGNNVKEGSEQCDGISGLSTASCKTLGNYSGGNVSCTKDCKYNLSQCISNISSCTNGKKDITEADIDCGGDCTPCGLNKTCFDNSDCASKKCDSNFKCVADSCNNTIFDNSSETDVDCGKDCKPCALDKNCLTNSDCVSNLCTDGKCSVDACSNGEKDIDESDIDCGGNCTLCDIGKNCNANSDCGSDNCADSVCAEPKPERNPVKSPLLIVGLIFMLSSGGYILYKTFIGKKSGGAGSGGMSSSRPPSNITSPMMPVRPAKLTLEQEKIVEKQREAMLKKRQGRADERKSVLQKLEESLTGEKTAEQKKTSKESDQDNEEFVDISKLKGKKSNEDKDTFSKLKDIGKNEDKVFEKLSSSEVNTISKKISQISGSPQDTIKPTLNDTNKLKYSDAIKLFGDIDRDMIMSGVFREILSQLLDSGKITKEHVSNILFEYMDKGIINKGDVAKISSELKIL